MSTPLVSMLRKYYPDAHIGFMAEPVPGQVLEKNPDINEIIYYPHKKDEILKSLSFFRSTGKKGWDLSIDALGTPGAAWASYFSGAKVRVGYSLRVRKWLYTQLVSNIQPQRYTALNKHALLKPIGITEESSELKMILTEDEMKFGKKFFEENKIDKSRFNICISPESRRQARRWFNSGWAELIDVLNEFFDTNIILLWGPGEEKTIEDITGLTSSKTYVIPKTTVREMASIMYHCDLSLSVNNGPMHMAVALGLPTVFIEGTQPPAVWKNPDDEKHKIVTGNVPCLGCWQNVCSHMSCMHGVTPLDIVEKICEIKQLNRFVTGDINEIRRNSVRKIYAS